MNDALIAEDLLLLLTDDRSGKLLVSSNQVDIALGGALLIELALEQRVDVAAEDGVVRTRRLLVKDASAASDSLLNEALAQIAAKQGREAKDVAPALGKGARARLHARLAERGLLHEETAKILGIFPSHRWPSSDTRRVDSVRALLANVLRAGSTDDAHIAGLVAPPSRSQGGQQSLRPCRTRDHEEGDEHQREAHRRGRLGVRGGPQGDRRDAGCCHRRDELVGRRRLGRRMKPTLKVKG